MGGVTGLQFAVESPERTQALVMSHTVGALTTDEIQAARAQGQRPDPVAPFGSWAVALDFPERNVRMAHLYNCISAFNVDYQEYRASAQRDRRAIEPAELEDFRVPTLFVTADKDLVVPPKVVELGAGIVPGARLVNLGEAGHSSYFEIADRFNAVVDDFLADVL